MAREVSKDEAELIIATNRHKELAGTLKQISALISQWDDKSVADAMQGQGDKINSLVKAITNTDINHEKVINSLHQMCEDIIASNNKVMDTLESRLLPESFTLVRGYGGLTESVKVNYKPSNQITIKN